MRRPHTERRDIHGIAALLAISIAGGGCGVVPELPDASDAVAGTSDEKPVELAADVVAIDAATGLPTRLSGTLSGGLQGTYDENILEVYFDATGAPIAALSRSTLTLNSPATGTLICMNLIIVSELVVATDESGAALVDAQGKPIIAGLHSASSGQIVYGAGDWVGTTGELRADSLLRFGEGAMGLGGLTSQLDLAPKSGSTLTPHEAGWSSAAGSW